MNLSDLNPHIRYARIHHSYFRTGKDMSICYDCRIFFAENAEGGIYVNGEKYNISSGTAIYLPPQTKYRFDFVNDENFKVIVIDFDLVNDFSHIKSSLGTASEKNFSPKRVVRYPLPRQLSLPILKPVPQISRTLSQCTENFLHRGSFYREISSALLKLCLIECIRESEKSGAHSELCDRVREYIRENYERHTLTNGEIADKFGYHPYHLSRIIKEETGKTLHQYLIDYRLRMAKNFLLTTQYDVERISWKSGFSSSAYFVKIFREKTGTTPKKYRQFRLHTEL